MCVGTDTYQAFAASFETDMATLLEINASRVELRAVRPGSLIADFAIAASENAPLSAESLADTFNSPGVIIANLQSEVAILLDDIKETAAMCNSPESAEILVTCSVAAAELAGGLDALLADLSNRWSGEAESRNLSSIENVQASQTQIDEWAAQYCASECNATLRPMWLGCNRGVYVLPKLSTALVPFAFLLDGFCGMLDDHMTGPSASDAIINAAFADQSVAEDVKAALDDGIPAWVYPATPLALVILWFYKKKKAVDKYTSDDEDSAESEEDEEKDEKNKKDKKKQDGGKKVTKNPLGTE